MNSQDFDKCRQFLEGQLSKNIENKELLAVYQKLLELKSQYDMTTDKAVIEKELRQAELEAHYHTTVHTANVDYDKAIHRNNTDFGIAANNNANQYYQHQMTTAAGVVNNAMNHGQFWNNHPQQNPTLGSGNF